MASKLVLFLLVFTLLLVYLTCFTVADVKSRRNKLSKKNLSRDEKESARLTRISSSSSSGNRKTSGQRNEEEDNGGGGGGSFVKSETEDEESLGFNEIKGWQKENNNQNQNQNNRHQELRLEDSFKFTRKYYNVSIPENSPGKTYATVVIGDAFKNFKQDGLAPGPDPGGGQGGGGGGQAVRLTWDDQTVSPYAKMGIYISDEYLVVRYKIISGDDKKVFKAEARRIGDFHFLLIRTRTSETSLNREYMANYHLIVRATVTSSRNENLKIKTKCDVYVEIEDRNDLIPYFYVGDYEVDVAETTAVDSNLIQVSAYDPDEGLNGEVYYSLQAEDSRSRKPKESRNQDQEQQQFLEDDEDKDVDLLELFAVHPKMGIITNTRQLLMARKKEEERKRRRKSKRMPGKKRYRLTVLASDRRSYLQRARSGFASKGYYSSKATVTINVYPVNKHRPKMTLKQHSSLITTSISPYHSSLPSSSLTSSDAITSGSSTISSVESSPLVYAIVHVTDEDGEDNIFGNICSLSIIDGNDLEMFQISNSSTSKNEYYIELKRPYSPIASNLHSYLNNTLDPTSSLSSPSGSTQNTKHRFGKPKITRNGFGFELNLTLKAEDCGGLFSTRSVNVLLNPFSAKSSWDTSFTVWPIVSLLRPTFKRKHYYAEISEIALIGSQVIHIEADLPFDYDSHIDVEPGFKWTLPLISYSIEDGNYQQVFGITQNGIIFTKKPLDYEQQTDYTLVVSAQLRSPLSGAAIILAPGAFTTQIHIKVLDANDNAPVFSNNSAILLSGSVFSISYDENKPNGSLVSKVFATDADSGENGLVSYSIANSNPVPFVIDQSSGEIRTTEILDYESGPRYYVLTVRASDWGTPFRRQAELLLNITIRDFNDHRPQFEKKDCTAYVPKDTKPWTEIITLSAIDFDVKNLVTYKLIADNECFDLEEISGILRLKCNLNEYLLSQRGSESAREMYVNVSATDGQYFADVMPIKVYIVDDDPLRTADFTSSIAERHGKIVVDCKTRNSVIQEKIRKYMLRDDHSSFNEVIGSEKFDHVVIPTLNEHQPEISADTPTEIYIRESVPKGAVCMKFSAMDPDYGFDGMLLWSLNVHQYEEFNNIRTMPFDIDILTGSVTVVDKIDRETHSKYKLNLTACDLGSIPGQLCTWRLIDVLIDDENDNPPKFDLKTYYFPISEDVQNGSMIGRLHATDSDAGENSVLMYSLQNHKKHFAVNTATGELTIKHALDREQVAKYKLHVIVHDSGTPSLSSTATVLIDVQDVNDNAPQFKETAYFARVREDFPVGALVMKISAFDYDYGRNARVSYSLKSDSSQQNRFSIDELTGQVRIAQPLDFEDKQLYNLSIVAKDEGEPVLSSEVYLLIEIEDVDENEHAPRFSDIVASGKVIENSPVGTYVMTVTAHDEDSLSGMDMDRTISYQIVSGDGLGRFSIDSQGNVTTLAVLDRESNWRYWLTVVAKDRAAVPKTSFVHLFIEVLDENDNAPVTREPFYVVSVAENASISTSILQLNAYDRDLKSGDSFRYRILNDEKDCVFKIDSLTGLLETKAKLDHELQAQYVLDIEVSGVPDESGGPVLMSKTPVVINILDVNDNEPMFIHNIFRCQTYNNLKNSFPICYIIGYDLDDIGENRVYGSDNGKLSYRIVDGNEYDFFVINEETGAIYMKDSGRTPKRLYELIVSVSDGGVPQKSSQVKTLIEVMAADQRKEKKEQNRPPYFAGDGGLDSNLAVNENEEIGTIVTLIKALDPDNDKIGIYIVDGNSDGAFAILNGALHVAKRIDYEKRQKYVLTIMLTDGIASAFSNVTISVIDVNDNLPRFIQELYTINVYENITKGSFILDLRVNDIDTMDKHAYNIYTSGSPQSLSKFDIERWSGRLRVKEPLDHELTNQHVLIIEATDSRLSASGRSSTRVLQTKSRDGAVPTVTPFAASSHRSFTKVVINVLDVNDHAPEFVSPTFEVKIPETSAVGTSVAQMVATDADTGHNAVIKYSIVSGNVDGVFGVNEDLGYIYVSKSVSVRLQPEYYLVVKASDCGEPPLSSSANVHVIITIPDNLPPVFEQRRYLLDVREDEKVGSIIINEVKAASRQILFYELISESGDSDYFGININSGEIYLRQQLDYESKNRFDLLVSATNLVGVNDTTSLVINVVDVNDNAPEWNATIFRGHVAESALVGSMVFDYLNHPLKVLAYDFDANQNGLLCYEINEKAAQQYFKIDSSTGAISVKKELDYETSKEINFTVSVTDRGEPFRLKAASDAVVIISIEDVNDCPPSFDRKRYLSTLFLPTYKDVVVTRLNATDCDIHRGKDSRQSSLVYGLIATGKSVKKFAVNETSGTIVVIDHNDLSEGSYELIATVSDGQFSAEAKVRITVQKLPKSSLRFASSKYVGHVTENSTAIKTVVVPSVLGSKLNEQLMFRILNAHTEMFRIARTSGAVLTSGIQFDREKVSKYGLVLEVRSVFHSSRIDHCLVEVTVDDVNDNPPVFVNLPYYFAVGTETQPEETIGKVQAIDLDVGHNGLVAYSIVSGNNNKLLSINPETGHIFLARSYHPKDDLNYHLLIKASDAGSPSLISTAKASVKVVSGGMPFFSKQYYHVSVPENQSPTVPFITVNAQSPQGRQLIYSITNGNDMEEFSLDFNSDAGYINGPCMVSVVERLDREVNSEYDLTITAMDSISGVSSSVPLHIVVEDVNDNAPMFNQSSYNATVLESLSRGSSILQVFASDRDAPGSPNSQIQYHLQGNDSQFYIAPETGVIYLKQQLDHETRSSHHLIVIASDLGSPILTSTAHIWINVNDVNDNPPFFLQNPYTAVVDENVGRGQFVTKVTAVDPDVSDVDNERLTYHIIGGNYENAFKIDQTTGIISTWHLVKKLKLRRITFADYKLNVSVSDGIYSALTVVRVKINPGNNRSPKFTKVAYDAVLEESVPVGTIVATVKALDPDEGQNGKVFYSIASQNSLAWFKIDHIIGVIRTIDVLDCEKHQSFVITIMAKDGGNRIGLATVRVTVTDVNDHAPEFLVDEYKAAICSSVNIGSTFIPVLAVDKDATPAKRDVFYSIIRTKVSTEGSSEDDDSFTKLFAINADNGHLYVKNNLSLVTQNVYQFFVKAKDQDGLENVVPITVRILENCLENPYSKNEYEFFVPENITPGSVVANINISGFSNVVLNFAGLTQITNNPDLSKFRIETNGRIVLTSQLDREEQSEYRLIVEYKDMQTFTTGFLNVIINVMDENDNIPRFDSESYFLDVSEDQELGSALARIHGYDTDLLANSKLKYYLKDEGTTGAELPTKFFELDQLTGWLTLRKHLDRETSEWHNVTVGITDGKHSNSTRFFLHVTDSNDNGPKFEHSKYSAFIYENVTLGTVLITVEAFDLDLVNRKRLDYYIIAGDPYNQFEIGKNGEMFVNKPLDRERVDKYLLEILATDTKFVCKTAIKITILDSNDNGPLCKKSKYVELVSEAVKPGTYLLTVEAEDADEGSNANLYYTLLAAESDSEGEELPFAIDSSSGHLKISSELDREKKSVYHLEARVHDDSQRSWWCSSSIEILLSDVNDNAPTFTSNEYHVSVPEDSQTGIIIGKVHAVDNDLGKNRKVRYAFIDSANEHFVIGEKTGIVRLNKQLDREERADYNLSVKAVDSGIPQLSSSALFLVKVQDVNDNAPEFTQKQYEAKVFENSTIGTEVLTILATSRDTGINAEINYHIVAGNEENAFTIHSKNGIISVSRTLDYELTKEYFLVIRAEDSGIPPLSSETHVKIVILDINDNVPQFVQKSYAAVLREDASVNEKIIQVAAVDGDSEENSKLRYYFLDKSNKEANETQEYKEFKIDPNTGIIYIASELDREMVSSYIMEVFCQDHGNPPLASSVLVSIEVSDVNDNPPLFEKSNYTVFVQENKPQGTVVLKFMVTDADSSTNAGPFTIDVIGGNEDGSFHIVQQDLTLRTSVKFDHSLHKFYQLQCKVTDSGTPPRSSRTIVLVTVIEESQYAPVLKHPVIVSVNAFLDQFTGGILAHLQAMDMDPYDQLTFDLVDNSQKRLFSIDQEDGTLMALRGLDVGSYSINISVSDGKFTSYGTVEVTVVLVTEEAVENSLQVRFSSVTPEQFILLHRKLFSKALRNTLNVRMEDVLIISIQPSKTRTKRFVKSTKDLDVVFAVNKSVAVGSSAQKFHSPVWLHKRISENQETIENLVGLKILVPDTDECKDSPLSCKHGQCKDEIAIEESQVLPITTEKTSFVSPRHERRVYCSCHPGFGGTLCEKVINECGRTPPPCPSYKECVPVSSPLGYTCQCPFGKTGVLCNSNADTCHHQQDVSFCYQEINPISFYGTSYARYILKKSNIESVSIRLKSLQPRASIMRTSGVRDYSILEIAGGYIQYRFDCGSGEGLIRVGDIPVNDGKWHEVIVERRGNSASVTLDGKYRGGGQAPGIHAVLNLDGSDLYFGADVKERPTALGGEDITHGFFGCLDNIRIDSQVLPLHVTGSSNVAKLKRLANVEFGNCGIKAELAAVCSANVCLNDATCVPLSNRSYQCICPSSRFVGKHCEVDLNPCASNPCTNGGTCTSIPHELCERKSNCYRCTCSADYTGMNCDVLKYCSPRNPCANEANCEETSKGVVCRCKPGYHGFYCEHDTDECSLPTTVCTPPATCVNLPGTYRCICPVSLNGSVACKGDRIFEPTKLPFHWSLHSDVIALVIIIIMLVSITCCIVCCCMWYRRKPDRHPLPENHYRMYDGADFLVKNTAVNEVNLKRLSKISNIDVAPIGPIGTYSDQNFQTIPHARPTSFKGTLNNFDVIPTATNDNDLEAAGQSQATSEQAGFLQNFKKTLPGTTVTTPPTVDSSQLTNTEGKIQNVHTALSDPSSGQPAQRASLSDSDLNGYLWDISDWAGTGEGGSNPMSDMVKVSVNEIRDSESNSDNSQIGLVSSQELNNDKATGSNGVYLRESEDDGENSLESSALLREGENDFEFADNSLPNSPIKYLTHPNDYLPVFQPNGEDEPASSWFKNDKKVKKDLPCVNGGLNGEHEALNNIDGASRKTRQSTLV